MDIKTVGSQIVKKTCNFPNGHNHEVIWMAVRRTTLQSGQAHRSTGRNARQNTNLLIFGWAPSLPGALLVHSLQGGFRASLGGHGRRSFFRLPFWQPRFVFLLSHWLLPPLFAGITPVLVFSGVMRRRLRDHRTEGWGKERGGQLAAVSFPHTHQTREVSGQVSEACQRPQFFF